jgi:hypothetical protein
VNFNGLFIGFLFFIALFFLFLSNYYIFEKAMATIPQFLHPKNNRPQNHLSTNKQKVLDLNPSSVKRNIKVNINKKGSGKYQN